MKPETIATMNERGNTMKSVEKLKKALIDEQNRNAETAKAIDDGLAAALKAKEDCEKAISKALQDENMQGFLSLRTKLMKIEGEIEYYTRKQRQPAAVENHEDLLREVYGETSVEYRKACLECIEKIEALEEASKKAGTILSEYAGAMAFYKATVKKLSILDGSLPDVYPNALAVRLADKLQYQKNGMKEFCNIHQ